MEEIKEEPIQEPVEKDKKKKKEKPQGLKYEIFDLVKTFVICFVAVILVTKFIVKPVQVDGDSMYPTLENNEIGVVNVISLKLQGIKRQDVVVVYNEEVNENWVKRVIGVPGDTVYAKNDVLYVNDKPLDEPYLNTAYAKDIRNQLMDGEHQKFTQDFDKVTLRDDEYFLMGDNRPVSHDSRAVGPFKEKDIIGKDAYIVFPFTEMKIVRNGEK